MFKEKMIQQLLHSAGLIKLPPLVKTLMVLIPLVLTLPTAVGQQDDFDRSLATFDQRADEVRVIVDSSRNPQANTVFESAIRTRGQAETTYRQGNLQAAKSLLDRAFALLVQAENLARSGGGGEPELQRLRNLLKSLRQSLQDSQRWLHELEINNRPGDTPSTVSSFLVEQSDRTEALLDRAEEECSNTESERCRDLLDRARLLFDQADQLLPVALEPSTGAAPGVENRLRDARQFLDRAQSELDQIQ